MVEICFIISELFKLDSSIYLTTTARLDRPLLETVHTILKDLCFLSKSTAQLSAKEFC